ncbi:MAG: single-stranded DNA-binding protein [Chloroflexi bacterium]|nr:single-stranded DNA-binding protein [Chloroflexota bacterium]
MNDDGGRRRGRSRGLNKVQIIGNLGRDPELRFTQDGTPVANFTVAVNETWRSRGGEQRERTEWFRVVVWSQLAEVANQYLRRGARVYLEGRLQTREWQDREGNDRTSTELVVRDLIMLGGRDDADGPPRDDDGGGGDRREPRGQQPQGGRANDDDSITADDLPF